MLCNHVSQRFINVGFQSLYFLLQVQGLSDELAKQLWMVLQRSMVTVRRDPTMLVSVVRIIEREEKIDRRMVDRKKQTGFIPPGRPKRWKDKMFEVRPAQAKSHIELLNLLTHLPDWTSGKHQDFQGLMRVVTVFIILSPPL